MGLALIRHVNAPGTQPTTTTRPIGLGILEAVSIIPVSDTIAKGEILVRLSLLRGDATDPFTALTFFHDYIYTNHYLSWSGHITVESTDILQIQTWSLHTYVIQATLISRPPGSDGGPGSSGGGDC